MTVKDLYQPSQIRVAAICNYYGQRTCAPSSRPSRDVANPRHRLSSHGQMESMTCSVIPVLIYEDIEAAHAHLVRVFGFASDGVERTPDGTVVHGEVRLGDARIWLHRVSDDLASPRTLTYLNSGLVVHVDDVDAHYRRAKDAGAIIDREPEDQPYGQREYGARDPEGHHWWFATATAPPALADRSSR